jgi:Tfp pilus assembly protein PilP
MKLMKALFVFLLVCMISACTENHHSSSMAYYVEEQESAPAKPIVETPFPSFVDYQPILYTLNPKFSPFGPHLTQQIIVPLLQSFPLAQLKMVGMAYFENKAWGFVLLPNRMVEKVGVGATIGTEGGKITAITMDTIVIEDNLASSSKINTKDATASIRRVELHLV